MNAPPGDHAAEPTRVLGPISMPTAVDEVTDRMLTAVALGEFVPGERLPAEREVARMLGVARNTVHEAFGRLRSAGIVEIRRGRHGGAYVRESWQAVSAGAISRALIPRRAELEHLCDLRCRYEEAVARAAAERRTPRQADELDRLLHVFVTAQNPQEQHAADMALHEGVLQATANPQMVALSRDLLARTALGLPIEPYDQTMHPQAVREHTALVVAVRDGRIEEAGTVAREHFSMSTRTLRAVMSRGEGEASA